MPAMTIRSHFTACERSLCYVNFAYLIILIGILIALMPYSAPSHTLYCYMITKTNTILHKNNNIQKHTNIIGTLNQHIYIYISIPFPIYFRSLFVYIKKTYNHIWFCASCILSCCCYLLSPK